MTNSVPSRGGSSEEPLGRVPGIARAIADREQGRSRLAATTATVGLASVAAAGVVAVGLPGPVSHATTTPSTGTSRGTSSGDQGTSQGDNGGQGLNPPAYVPASGGGGAPVSTSGGTHSGF